MDLVRAGISIDSKNEQAGVYLRIYWDFRDQPQRKPELYVGQAGNLHKRSLRHLQDTKTNDKSNHYLAARQAKKYKAFPIALTSDLKLRTIIEQLGVMLFMSYVMVIRGYSTKIEVTRTIDPQKVVDVQTKYYRDGQSANILSRAAEEAATHIGWKAGCERPGFGSDIGLNWRSPLSTMDPINDPIIWVRTDNPGVVATFRRSPTTARDSAGARVFMNKANVTGDSNFKVKTKSSTEGLPALGTEVHVVAEVMLNGEQHPHAWARYVCLTNCLDLLLIFVIDCRLSVAGQIGTLLWVLPGGLSGRTKKAIGTLTTRRQKLHLVNLIQMSLDL